MAAHPRQSTSVVVRKLDQFIPLSETLILRTPIRTMTPSILPSADGTCPRGFHTRRAYTVRRTGSRVPTHCVRATTPYEPRSEFLRATRRKQTRRLQGFRRMNRGEAGTVCPPGTILRAPYVRIRGQKTIKTRASCIKDQGAPGKGLRAADGSPAAGIGPLRKGDLAVFGYSDVKSMTEGARHLALARAVAAYGSLTVWRKLNAIYVYGRRTAPASSSIFKADRDWVKSQYGIKAF